MVDKVLMLRTCEADMTSYEGFVWPESGPVEAPDWLDDDECGHGLHGLLWGEGDMCQLMRLDDAKWLVVEVERSDMRELGGKYKFPRGEVIMCGSREAAVKCIQLAAPGEVVQYGTTIAGLGGTAIAGHFGTATTGHFGTATAGDNGIATAGYCGTAIAGHCGTAIAGIRGAAIAGHCGTAIIGTEGNATAGIGGILISKSRDAKGMPERRVAMVGQEGILPNIAYRCVQGEWVEV